MPKPGIYFGTPVGGESILSAKKGTPGLTVRFNVTHVAGQGGEWVDIPPFERSVTCYFTEGSAEMSWESLNLIEFDGNFDNPSFGKGCSLECYFEPYNNKQVERWEFYRPKEVKRADSDAIREMNRFWKSLGGSKGVQKQQPKTEVEAAMAAQAPPSVEEAPQAVVQNDPGATKESELPF